MRLKTKEDKGTVLLSFQITSERIQREVAQNNKRNPKWALTGKTAISIKRGNCSGIIVAPVDKGYGLFREVLKETELKDRNGRPLIWPHGTNKSFP